jgi:SAM-dependent methyltransferase
MFEHPFDTAALEYDTSFAGLQPGRWYREMVWREMDRYFEEGTEVLDLGCGTGEDAVYLARRGVRVRAVDVSEGMLEKARDKTRAADLEGRISFTHGDLSDLASDEEPLSDGALSDFGPLNCLEDLAPFAEGLAGRLKPGAPVLLVVMGPICPWEILWYLLHFRFPTAFRRFKRGLQAPVGGGPTIAVWYHSPRAMRRAMQPYFEVRDLVGIGSLLPPPYLSGLVARAPKLFGWIARIDRRLGHFFPFTWLNDHYLLVVTRRG